MEGNRHSKAFEPDLTTGEAELARTEAANVLRQFDAVIERTEFFLEPDRTFQLRASLILDLHRIALSNISSRAGVFRSGNVKISGSRHVPPGAHLVAGEVETLCDYVNKHWETASSIHLAAYVLWRMNWIHPFTDGNGRTSRAVSYLVLCTHLKCVLPGTNTVPAQIAADKKPYYRALESADRIWRERSTLDVSDLEALLGELLAAQLLDVHRRALASPTPEI